LEGIKCAEKNPRKEKKRKREKKEKQEEKINFRASFSLF